MTSVRQLGQFRLSILKGVGEEVSKGLPRDARFFKTPALMRPPQLTSVVCSSTFAAMRYRFSDVKLVRLPDYCGCLQRGLRIGANSFQLDKDPSESELAKGDKIMRVNLKTTRVDAVLKVGLSLSRNKIEKALYEDRIRVNGERPSKKSQVVYEGDEVDIVRGYNKLNPNFIDVSRVEVMELRDPNDQDPDDSGSEDDEEFKVPAVLKRAKLLTIKNYDSPWKGNTSSD